MAELKSIKAIVTDIEGTTSSISFVHEVLFPFAKENLPTFLEREKSREEVRRCLNDAKQFVKEESGEDLSDKEMSERFLEWIAADRKQTQLKQLQGMIWVEGYQNGSFKGHVYEDVPECLKAWNGRGLKLSVFSSGSVPAQKLLFGYSEAGDLTPLFANYFDTTTGPKKESASYKKIVAELSLNEAEVLFLSDVEGELDAAKEAGLATIQVLRPGIEASSKHRTVANFHEITNLVFDS